MSLLANMEQVLVLLNLGICLAAAQDLKLLYEKHPEFNVLPTYAIITAHPSLAALPLEEYIPSFDRAKALHGEQYLEMLSSLPTAGTVISRPQLIDIRDKGVGKGCVVVVRVVTTDAATGKDLAVSEFTSFVLGTGGFGSPWPEAPRPAAATAANVPPSRPPDATVTELIKQDQAALYRLNGDYNPLHIDPAVASTVGFAKPILHGLCTMGISVKHVINSYGGGDPNSLKTVKVRFSKHVFPGESIRVDMWKVSENKVVFTTTVVERNQTAISNAAVEFTPGKLQAKCNSKL